MRHRNLTLLIFMIGISSGISYAAGDQASPGTQATPQTLGGQAGEAARDVKNAADETLSAGAVKVAESSRKVQAEAQETLKTLQRQWDVLAKQLEEKTQEIRKQLEQQWRDFNESFNNSKQ